jgi:hypothetical protein
MVCTSASLLSLNQCIDNLGSTNPLDSICFKLNDICSLITSVDSGIARSDNYHLLRSSIFNSALSLVLKITYIFTVNSHLGIIHCFIIFSQLMAGFDIRGFCCRQPQWCCSTCQGAGNSPYRNKL